MEFNGDDIMEIAFRLRVFGECCRLLATIHHRLVEYRTLSKVSVGSHRFEGL